MGKYKNQQYPLRIDNTVHAKIKYIAQENGRTINNMYEQIAKQYVAAYEAEHGEIPLPDHDPVGGGYD